jgi:hypothetical protein
MRRRRVKDEMEEGGSDSGTDQGSQEEEGVLSRKRKRVDSGRS